MFWNVSGDPRQPDPIHDATNRLLSRLGTSPSHPIDEPLPFALDVDGRRSAFQAARAGSVRLTTVEPPLKRWAEVRGDLPGQSAEAVAGERGECLWWVRRTQPHWRREPWRGGSQAVAVPLPSDRHGVRS